MEKNDVYAISFLAYEIIEERVCYNISFTNKYTNETYFKSVRYSQLRDLHKNLKDDIDELPAFPPKQFWGNLKQAFILKRKNQLENYFNQVLENNQIEKLTKLINFFCKNEEDNQKNLDEPHSPGLNELSLKMLEHNSFKKSPKKDFEIDLSTPLPEIKNKSISKSSSIISDNFSDTFLETRLEPKYNTKPIISYYTDAENNFKEYVLITFQNKDIEFKYQVISMTNHSKYDWKLNSIIEEELVEEIKGKMTQVYLAEDIISKNMYELKMISFENDQCFSNLINIFLKEIAISDEITKIIPENSMKIYDVYIIIKSEDSPQKHIVIVREICDCTLEQIINFRASQNIYWSEAELLGIMKKILIAADKLHTNKIIHRDFIPGKIFYNKEQKEFKFGELVSAKKITEEKERYNIKGAPGFLSPELQDLLQKNPTVTKLSYNPFLSDIYSLGLTFLCMKCLKPNLSKDELIENMEQLNFSELSTQIITEMISLNPVNRPSFSNCIEKIPGELIEEPNESLIVKLLLETKDKENLKNLIQKSSQLATAYSKLLDFSKAKKELKQLRFLLQSKVDKSKEEIIDFGSCLLNLGNAYFQLQKTNKALGCFNSALELKDSLEYSMIRECYICIGDVYRMNKEFNIAVKNYEEALFLIESEEVTDQFNIYSKLGGINQDLEEFEKARFWYEKALATGKRVYGEDSNQVAIVLNELGHTCISMEKFDKASKYLLQALDLTILIFGEKHNYVGVILNNLGDCHCENNSLDTAIFFYEQALNINLNCFGKHPNTANILSNIGILFNKKKDYKKAIENFEKAIEMYKNFKEIWTRNHKEAYANLLNNLGVSLRNIEKNEEAIKCYEESINFIKEIRGEGSINLSNTYNNLGIAYSNIKNFEKSVYFFKLSLEILQKNLESPHINISRGFSHLGQASLDLGDYESAVNYYQECLNIKKQLLQKNHPSLGNTYFKLGIALVKKLDQNEAKKYLGIAEDILLQSLPNTHPKLQNLSNLIKAL